MLKDETMIRTEIWKYIFGYVSEEKVRELSQEQKDKLEKYVADALEGRRYGTFRYLVYNILDIGYDMDYLDLNNSLWRGERGERNADIR